jgi:hypothetical protein
MEAEFKYISNYGLLVFPDGRIMSSIGNHEYKHQDSNGYKLIQKTIDGKRRSLMVHRLVAMAFLGIPENFNELDVNHKDANKSNNHFSNLEWCTHKENMEHGKKMKLFKPGPGRPFGSKDKNKRERK